MEKMLWCGGREKNQSQTDLMPFYFCYLIKPKTADISEPHSGNQRRESLEQTKMSMKQNSWEFNALFLHSKMFQIKMALCHCGCLNSLIKQTWL